MPTPTPTRRASSGFAAPRTGREPQTAQRDHKAYDCPVLVGAAPVLTCQHRQVVAFLCSDRSDF